MEGAVVEMGGASGWSEGASVVALGGASGVVVGWGLGSMSDSPDCINVVDAEGARVEVGALDSGFKGTTELIDWASVFSLAATDSVSSA